MPKVFHPVSASGLVFVLSAGSAMADLTAEQVWAEWQAYFKASGYEVTATESQTGNGIALSGVTLSLADDDPTSSFTIDLSDMTFSENGDGTVDIDLAEQVPISISGQDEAARFSVEMTLVQTAPEITVSGDPEQMVYDYTAERATIGLDGFEADGESLPPDMADFSVDVAQLVGQATVGIGENRSYDQTLSASSAAYTFGMENPETGETFKMTGTLEGLTSKGAGVMPAEMDPYNLSAALAAGFTASGDIAFAKAQSETNFSGGGGSGQISTSSTGGTFGGSFESGGASYSGSQTGLSVNAQVSQFPLPISATMAESAFTVAFPVTKSEEDQDFDLKVTLKDLALSDQLWNIFDAQSVLPRDPATLEVDLTGTGVLGIDFLDPNFAADPTALPEAPGELTSLMVNRLLLSLAGAQLTGDGAFTFDNTNTEEFGGMPAPRGALNLKLVGGNGLLDNLVKLGFVPQEQAMGARMMMGLFGVPDAEPDTLTSKLEINEQGHILANGQRIQ